VKETGDKKVKAIGNNASNGAGNGAGNSGSLGPKVEVKVAQLHVSGGGSSHFNTKQGGDNSIQEFGGEADESELTEAAVTLHSYLVAFASDDWTKACSYMAKSLVENFKHLGAQAGSNDSSCAEGFAALYGATARSAETRHQITEVDAASLRREGEQAFLVYHGTAYDTGSYYGVGDLYAIPMKQEEGRWKVGLVMGDTMGIARSLEH
jgi:hypothetical protein